MAPEVQLQSMTHEDVFPRDRREGELKLFSYYKVLALLVKQYSVIWKWTWISCKCIASSRETTKQSKRKKYNWYAKRGEKMENHIKYSMKISKGTKRVENKIVTKNKGNK